MANIFLKNVHHNSIPEQAYYFYDGEVVVRYGIIEVPSDNQTWLQRVWYDGYRIDPETGKTLEMQELFDLNSASAESAGDNIEGTDFGGQPSGEDGVREGELPRTDSVPVAGVGSSRRPRASKRASGN